MCFSELHVQCTFYTGTVIMMAGSALTVINLLLSSYECVVCTNAGSKFYLFYDVELSLLFRGFSKKKKKKMFECS